MGFQVSQQKYVSTKIEKDIQYWIQSHATDFYYFCFKRMNFKESFITSDTGMLKFCFPDNLVSIYYATSFDHSPMLLLKISQLDNRKTIISSDKSFFYKTTPTVNHGQLKWQSSFAKLFESCRNFCAITGNTVNNIS